MATKTSADAALVSTYVDTPRRRHSCPRRRLLRRLIGRRRDLLLRQLPSRPRFRFRVRGIGAHRQATLFVPLTGLHTLMMV
eukprot:COSAG06_NODE_5536_length_3418_cov_2.936728_1_plen_81_part_00